MKDGPYNENIQPYTINVPMDVIKIKCQNCFQEFILLAPDNHSYWLQGNKNSTLYCPYCGAIAYGGEDKKSLNKQDHRLTTDLYNLLEEALSSFCLTHEYFGPSLPPLDGWSWFDTAIKIAKIIPDSIWAKRLYEIVDDYKEE